MHMHIRAPKGRAHMHMHIRKGMRPKSNGVPAQNACERICVSFVLHRVILIGGSCAVVAASLGRSSVVCPWLTLYSSISPQTFADPGREACKGDGQRALKPSGGPTH